MTKKLSLSLLLACAAVCIAALFPVFAHAESPFLQQSVAGKVTDRAAMYFMTYRFSNTHYDVHIPLVTQRISESTENGQKIGYTVREDGTEVTTQGTSIAINLSNAQVVNGMYVIPKGTIGEFVFFGIVTTAEDTPEMDYAMKIDRLPIYRDSDEGPGVSLDNIGLTPGELQYFVTPEVELNG